MTLTLQNYWGSAAPYPPSVWLPVSTLFPVLQASFLYKQTPLVREGDCLLGKRPSFRREREEKGKGKEKGKRDHPSEGKEKRKGKRRERETTLQEDGRGKSLKRWSASGESQWDEPAPLFSNLFI